MLRKFLIILALICFSDIYSQDVRIIIPEKIQSRQIGLIVENTTTDTLNIFPMVISEVYRLISISE